MLLEVRGLEKSYRPFRKAAVAAVRSVSFQLAAGEILAFLGPNGAGKTTTIKMIAGLVQPDAGDVLIDGATVVKRSQRALASIGAVLEGSRNLYWRLTPLENLEYWGGLRGMSRRQARERGLELLDAFGLGEKRNSTVQQLSRGMQQQVAICAALLHSPRLLLLDEPTLGLDLEASDRIQGLVKRLARERGIGILLTTHQMDVAEALSHRVAIVRQGELILIGDTAQVIHQFAGNAYVFELEDMPDPSRVRHLRALGAEFETDTRFRMVLEDDDPYPVLRLLEPLRLARFERDTADLATVFRHYTRKEA